MKFANLKLFEKTRFFYIFSCVAIFVLIYIPAFFVPVHSDDYFYFLQGLSFEAHLKHYLNWSGRFITDYTSSLLLNLFPKSVYMGINSIAFLVILINISLIPSIIAKDKFINSKSAVLLWVAFFLYWLCNPNLGQTSFWLVGSANYLWTLMWASLYMVYLLNLLQNEIKPNLAQMILLCVLGLFAGLSNEGTGVSIVFFTFILFFIYKNQRKTLIIAFLATFVGFLIIILAPGNYARLSMPQYRDFIELSLYDRIFFHLFKRVPKLVLDLKFFLLVILILSNLNKEFNKIKFCFVFLILAFFSILSFALSPVTPYTVTNTARLFLIITSAIIFYNINIRRNIFFVILICVICFFALSWSRFTYAMIQLHFQEQIRNDLIYNAKDNQEINIPHWYLTKFVEDPDRVFSVVSLSMPQYYHKKTINHTKINFNYAPIRNEPLNFKLIQVPNLVAVYYNNGKRDNITRFLDDNILIFEFTKPLKADEILIINYSNIAENSFTEICNLVKIGENYYCALNLGKKRLKSLKKMDFKFYQKSSSYSFDANLHK